MNISEVSYDEPLLLNDIYNIPLGYNIISGDHTGDNILCNAEASIKTMAKNCNEDINCKGMVIDKTNGTFCLKSEITPVNINANGIVFVKNDDMVSTADMPLNYGKINNVVSGGEKIICPNYSNDWQRYADDCDALADCVGFSVQNNQGCLKNNLNPVKFSRILGNKIFIRDENVPKVIDLARQPVPTGFSRVLKNKANHPEEAKIQFINSPLYKTAIECQNDPECLAFDYDTNKNASLIKNLTKTINKDNSYIFVKDGIQLPEPEKPAEPEKPKTITVDLVQEEHQSGTSPWAILFFFIVIVILAIIGIVYVIRKKNREQNKLNYNYY